MLCLLVITYLPFTTCPRALLTIHFFFFIILRIPHTTTNYLQLFAAPQQALLDGLDLVAGQVQHSQVGQGMQLGRGEDRVERVAEQIIGQVQLHEVLVDAHKHLVGQPTDRIVRVVQLLQW